MKTKFLQVHLPFLNKGNAIKISARTLLSIFWKKIIPVKPS